MSTLRTWSCAGITVVNLLLALAAPLPLAAQEAASSEEISTNAVSDAALSNDTLRAYLQLQEQVHATQLAIETARQETTKEASKASELFAGRLHELERKLSNQRADETKLMLYVLSAFGALSFFAVIVTAYFQWRTVNRLAQFTAALPSDPSHAATVGALPFSEAPLLGAGQVEQVNARLMGAVERLEKRILELEHAAQPSLSESHGEATVGTTAETALETAVAVPLSEPVIVETENPEPVEIDVESRVKRLLERGQTLLNEEKPEAAIEAFDAVLAISPDHTEALVKKGLALEKVRKLAEAIQCYDQAIAADSNMTIAYLYKGGLFNRLERFGEAVECYEKALRTQEKRSAA